MADESIQRNPSGAYVYEIIVNGVVRYIGKGRNGRAASHVKEARRIIERRQRGIVIKTSKFYNGLCAALKRGDAISWRVVESELTDEQAYRREEQEIKSAPQGSLLNLLRGGEGGDPAFFRSFWENPEARRKMSEQSKKSWADPEYRERANTAAKERAQRPEFKALRSADMKQRFSKDEYRENHSDKTRQRWARDRETITANLQKGRDAAKDSFRAAANKMWADPQYREKMCKAQQARWTPEARKIRSDLMKAKYSKQ